MSGGLNYTACISCPRAPVVPALWTASVRPWSPLLISSPGDHDVTVEGGLRTARALPPRSPRPSVGSLPDSLLVASSTLPKSGSHNTCHLLLTEAGDGWGPFLFTRLLTAEAQQKAALGTCSREPAQSSEEGVCGGEGKPSAKFCEEALGG